MKMSKDAQDYRDAEKIFMELADATGKIAYILERSHAEEEIDSALKDFYWCLAKMNSIEC